MRFPSQLRSGYSIEENLLRLQRQWTSREFASVSHGIEEYISMESHPDADACVENLARRGYRVLVSSLGDGAVDVDQIDVTQKVALVFGNENSGVSQQMIRRADG